MFLGILIDEPGYVVVLDSTLIGTVDVTKGLKKGGFVLINTNETNKTFGFEKNFKVATIDARAIANEFGLGSKSSPIVNTAVLGAFSKFTGLVKMSSVIDAIKEKIPVKVEGNVKAAEEAFRKVSI